jgi:hypothetical protein
MSTILEAQQLKQSKQTVSDILFFEAGDDAKKVNLWSVSDVLTGKHKLAFAHVYLLVKFFEQFPSEDVNIDVLHHALLLTKYYNINLLLSVNERIADLIKDNIIPDTVKYMPISSEMMDIYNHVTTNLDEILEVSTQLNFDPTLYLRPPVTDDIEQCTDGNFRVTGNDRTLKFCLLSQMSEPNSASDNVKIFKGTDGYYMVVIVREFGPGREDLAFAGGFLEKNETFKQASLREAEEEAKMTIGELGNITYTKQSHDIEPIFSNWWDPRAKFPAGMINSAHLEFYDFTQSDVSIM